MDVAVSVVLPVYNALRASPRYLPEAIESVLGQSMRDFELVVVDDGSDEDYGPVRARYTDNRIVWLRLEKNGGQAAARNVGVDRARGKVVAFIDQDDRFYPERLERGVEAYKDCIMTYSDIDEIDADGSIMTPRALAAHQPGRHPIKSLPDLLAWDSLVLPGTCLLARETFLATGGFDPQLSGYEDDDFFVRVFRMGPVRFIETPLLQYRIYPESYRSSSRVDASRRNYFRKLVSAFRDGDPPGRYWVRDRIAPRFSGLWLTRIRYALRASDAETYRMAVRELAETSAYGPPRLRAGGAILGRIPYPAARVVYKLPRFSYLARVIFGMRRRPKR